ncbi:MAG: hypothetical protein WAN35_03785 [Terracidiphilus sp.]
MGLKEFLNRVFHVRLYPAGKATSDAIRRITSPCPVCNQSDLNGHQYTEFASQIAKEVTDELKDFFRLFSEKRWRELNSISEFDGKFNAAVLYAFFCPEGACMIAVRDPEELFENMELLDVILLGEEEAVDIKSMRIELHDL